MCKSREVNTIFNTIYSTFLFFSFFLGGGGWESFIRVHICLQAPIIHKWLQSRIQSVACVQRFDSSIIGDVSQQEPIIYKQGQVFRVTNQYLSTITNIRKAVTYVYKYKSPFQMEACFHRYKSSVSYDQTVTCALSFVHSIIHKRVAICLHRYVPFKNTGFRYTCKSSSDSLIRKTDVSIDLYCLLTF